MNKTRVHAAGLALVCAFLTSTAPGHAQETIGGAARASFDTSLRITSFRGGADVLAGGVVLFGVDDRVLLGGGGWVPLGKSVIPGATRASDLELRVSYGGLVVEARMYETPRGSLSVRTLLGAGNGGVALPVVGTVIAADNFGIVEPEISLDRPVRGPLHVVAGAGYRIVFGLEDLPGVTSADLRGLVFRVGLTARGF